MDTKETFETQDTTDTGEEDNQKIPFEYVNNNNFKENDEKQSLKSANIESEISVSQPEETENKTCSQKVKEFKLFQLFGRSILRTTLLSLIIWFVNVFAYYGVNDLFLFHSIFF